MSMGFPRSAHQTRVDEFMVKAQQAVPTAPVELDENTRLLRAKLIYEEVMHELIWKGLGVSVTHRIKECGDLDQEFAIAGPFNMQETIDGCLDGKVVITGTLTAMGIPDERFQKLVDDNNLAKFGPGGYRDTDGKWRKPPGHEPPKIKELLEELKQWQSESR